jgi:hypothetical protein
MLKTIPLRTWRLATAGGRELVCAHHHLVMTGRGLRAAWSVRETDVLETEHGPEPVTASDDTGRFENLYDLRVESEDHLYFSGGILSHNSTGVGAAEYFKFNAIPNYRMMYIAPMPDHVKTFATLMIGLQRGSVYTPELYRALGLRDNMYDKESPKGGYMKLVNVLSDPSRVRGNSMRTVVIDECAVSTTKIGVFDTSGKNVVLELAQVRPGMVVFAHDHQHAIVTDRVRSVTPKGKRPVWTLRLDDGKELTCTSNEKIRTTKGWIFLSQLLPPYEIARCNRAQQIQRIIAARDRHDSGVNAGRPFGGMAPGGDPEVPSDARLEAGVVSKPQGGTSFRLHNDASEVGEESRLWGVELSVSYGSISGVRILTRNDAAPDTRENKSTENRNQGMGGSPDAEGAGLLAHGRRDATGEVCLFHDPQLLRSGVSDSGGSPRGNGLRGSACPSDVEEQQAVSHCGDSDGRDAEISGGHQALRPPVNALQVGASGQLPDVRLLSRGVRDRATGEAFPELDLLLPESDLPPTDGRCPAASAAGAVGSCETHNESEATGKASGHAEGREASNGQGYTREDGSQKIQPHAAGVAGTPQEIGNHREADTVARMPILLERISDFQTSPSPDHGQGNQLPGRGVCKCRDEGAQGGNEGSGQSEVGDEQGEFGDLVPVAIESITYAGEQEVWDLETENHHTFFADGIAVHNCQGFDPRFLPEISQVQKAFREQRYTVFSGTALDLDTCLQMQFDRGSRGIWHVHCGCKDKFHPLNDIELIPRMMTPVGLRCPNNGTLLDTGKGLFVHEDTSQFAMNNVSLHLPQVIVPEYAQGAGFLEIWSDYENYPYQKFLREVMGIATEEGVSELTKAELLNCCTDKGFKETQAQITPTRSPYKFIVSGCDWGGSDTLSDAKSKISYTVHVIYGLHSDGHYDLLYANRYNTVNYREIAQHIVEVHNRFKAFAIGADDGGGAYYNAYLRDCGRIPNERVITFAYTDTQMFIKRLDHPEIQKLSLHRTDSLSAFIGDIKDKKVRFPNWGESATFLQDCLNMRRNMTTSNSGRTVMRYLRKATASDDFMHASNFALMVLRILTRQPSIPNKELMDEMARSFGTMAHSPTPHDLTRMTGGLISG